MNAMPDNTERNDPLVIDLQLPYSHTIYGDFPLIFYPCHSDSFLRETGSAPDQPVAQRSSRAPAFSGRHCVKRTNVSASANILRQCYQFDRRDEGPFWTSTHDNREYHRAGAFPNSIFLDSPALPRRRSLSPNPFATQRAGSLPLDMGQPFGR